VRRLAIVAGLGGLALLVGGSVCLWFCWPTITQRLHSPKPAASWHVYFSPHGDCTAAVVSALDDAKSNILVQAYSFTSAPIAEALVKAKKRGVTVQVILDRSQKTERYSSATFLQNSEIPTFIDSQHAIAHNKVMVIDSATVITGSFNFTKAAEEKNAENLLVIQDAQLAEKYSVNWTNHLRHSEQYEGATQKQ
jgi:phosphatidylserine/phosphatidylglycerophosphate/cardiolipin synthase-like enzyme